MNSLPKYVVSSTLKDATWNNAHIISHNVVKEVVRLKQQAGRDILVYGSGELVRSLLKHGLVDQMNLLVYPVVLGRQTPVRRRADVWPELADTQTFSSGVVRLTYTLGGKRCGPVTFQTTLLLGGKTATGLEVPPEIIERLGAGKRPAVGDAGSVRLPHHRRGLGGKSMLPVSAEHRAGAGIKAGDAVDVTLELDTELREWPCRKICRPP